jgi:hypothetical protein
MCRAAAYYSSALYILFVGGVYSRSENVAAIHMKMENLEFGIAYSFSFHVLP